MTEPGMKNPYGSKDSEVIDPTLPCRILGIADRIHASSPAQIEDANTLRQAATTLAVAAAPEGGAMTDYIKAETEARLADKQARIDQLEAALPGWRERVEELTAQVIAVETALKQQRKQVIAKVEEALLGLPSHERPHDHIGNGSVTTVDLLDVVNALATLTKGGTDV